MQPISSFQDNLGTAILLVGGAGAGKTVLSMSLFPKTYVFVADLNFKSGKDYLQKHNKLDRVVGFDTATPDENGKPVPANMRYTRMLAKLNEAQKNPEVDCIVLDSATFIEDIIKAKVCNAADETGIRLEGYTQWENLKLIWKSLIMGCRQTSKKLIMTSHETKEKDESDQLFKYQIAVDGGIRAKFPALFSDVWRCEVVEVGIGATAKHVWQVRTLSNQRQEHLKNTYGLEAVVPADDIVKRIGGQK